MRRFSTVDLDQKLGDVKAAAARQPVVITEHRKDRFVLMSVEDFAKLKLKADPRRVFGPGETPARLARLFDKEIARLLNDDSR
jgi:prevent-host-death family protein